MSSHALSSVTYYNVAELSHLYAYIQHCDMQLIYKLGCVLNR
jgi:hypothetical protein